MVEETPKKIDHGEESEADYRLAVERNEDLETTDYQRKAKVGSPSWVLTPIPLTSGFASNGLVQE